MVHYLQDDKTNRLNIDVIDLSNLIFICSKTGFLEFDEQHQVAPNHFYSIWLHLAPLFNFIVASLNKLPVCEKCSQGNSVASQVIDGSTVAFICIH